MNFGLQTYLYPILSILLMPTYYLCPIFADIPTYVPQNRTSLWTVPKDYFKMFYFRMNGAEISLIDGMRELRFMSGKTEPVHEEKKLFKCNNGGTTFYKKI